MILLALAIGFGLIEALSWQEFSPGLFAILLAAAGLDLAADHLSRHAKQPAAPPGGRDNRPRPRSSRLHAVSAILDGPAQRASVFAR